MLKILKNKLKKKIELTGLLFLILSTAFLTTYFNYKKNISQEAYNNFIDNIYFKKTFRHLVDSLDPKYKKIKHKIKSGETFDKILESYSIKKNEITKIKKTLTEKVNLNKLKSDQIIQFSIDKTNEKINEFYFQVSNTQKIKAMKPTTILLIIFI